MSRPQKVLLTVAAVIGALLVRAARREVAELEAEAALWAEATEPLDD